MFNVGGGELLAILLIALIVLGPDRLPGAVRQAGQWVGELRKISSGFQDEIRSAFDEHTQVIDGETTVAPAASEEPSAPAVGTEQVHPPADPADPIA